MILGGVIEVLFGIDAEGRSLESVARPLTAVSEQGNMDASRGKRLPLHSPTYRYRSMDSAAINSRPPGKEKPFEQSEKQDK